MILGLLFNEFADDKWLWKKTKIKLCWRNVIFLNKTCSARCFKKFGFISLGSGNCFNFPLTGSTVITNSIPAQEARTTIDNPVIKNSSPTSLKDHLDDGIRKLQGVLPASNTGIIIAMISLSLTLVCSIVIACRKCKKRGKGKGLTLEWPTLFAKIVYTKRYNRFNFKYCR